MSFSKKILVFFSLLLLFMGTVSALYWDQYFFVVKSSALTFAPNNMNVNLLDESRQKAELVLENLKGQNIWRLDIEALREKILQDRWVAEISVERELPQKLRVEVQLQDVALLYVDKQQRLVAINAEGELLRPVLAELAPDVPLMKNHQLIKTPQKLKQLVELYRQLPADGFISQNNLAFVDWSDTEGFKVELNSAEEGAIVLGFDRVPQKAQRVENVLKYLETQNQRWRVIDASFSKKVLVRLRKRS